MTPQPLAQRAGDRQRAGEPPERLLVVGREQQQVLPARARRERAEAQVADAVQAVERLRRDVRRDRRRSRPRARTPRRRRGGRRRGSTSPGGRRPARPRRPTTTTTSGARGGPRTRRSARRRSTARPSAVPRTRAGRLRVQIAPGRAPPTARPARRQVEHAAARARARASPSTGPRRRYVRSCSRSPSHTAHQAVRAGPDPRARRAQHQLRAERPDPGPGLVHRHGGYPRVLRD